ncbi:MAG: oxidoreductase [Acidobacteria bacterium]|nr:MAG: oxidoreductase [Acidobacteriota bacterium]
MIAKFQWQDARTVQDAIAQLDGTSMVKAGGIDVMDRLKEGLDSPATLVNIRTIPGLDQIREDATGLHIGPMVTLDQLDKNETVRASYTALADAAGHAATPHIRNVATVGGNILQRPRCWYFRNEQFHCLKKGGDRCFAQDGENEYHAIFGNQICAIVHPSAVAVALLALGATFEVTGKRGERQVPSEQFFVRPDEDVHREHTLAADELLTAINIPKPASGTRSAYMKLGEKESFDWPIAEVAVVLGARPGVVLGAAAPVPWRAVGAERILAGNPINEDTARAAAKAALQGATPLRNNSYKLPIFETIVRRTILAAARA